MRRALAAVAVGLAAVPAAAGAAPPPRSFAVPERMEGESAVLGGALYYVVGSSRRPDTVKRLDLTTLQRATVYRAPSLAWDLGAPKAGGGRLVIDAARAFPPYTSRVLEVSPAGGPSRTLASGRVRLRARRGACGTNVEVADVSPDGAVLVDQERMSCSSGPVRHALVGYAAGPPFLVRRYVERLNDNALDWRLVSGRLLSTSAKRATLAGRTFRPTRRFEISGSDLDAAGDVAIAETRVRGRGVRDVVRLYGQAGVRVLLDVRGARAEPRFCGNRLVIETVAPNAQQLLVYDDPVAGAPRTVFSAVRRSPDLGTDLICDPDTGVLLSHGARSAGVDVVPLAP